MNTLIIDKTDPDQAAMVASWQDGQEYTLTNMQVRQVSSDDKEVRLEVLSMEEGEPAAGDDTAEESAEPAAPAATAPASKPPALKKVASSYPSPM